ncbi:MAG: S8 family serine peptidase, partial [Candidatus Saccharimonadales bacterium]|nr:S8 family serine peptidase [Candidatus Saccharimonadales bacterium]
MADWKFRAWEIGYVVSLNIGAFEAWAVSFVIVVLLFFTLSVQAVNPIVFNGPEEVNAPYSPNSVLVKFKKSELNRVNSQRPESVGIPSVAQTLEAGNATKIEQLARASSRSNQNTELFSWYKVSLDENRPITAQEIDGVAVYADVEDLIDRLERDPAVEAVQKDYIVEEHLIPNDPYYSSSGSWGQGFDDLWGLKRIGLETAWDTTTGDSSVVTAIIDSGVEITHSDLSGNIWTNPGEIQSNGIDDDGNGYIDDYNGWDWYEDDNETNDPRGHGTHVAGTVAAVSNNATGVAGVSWNTKLMPLRFLGPTGTGLMSDGVLALQYAADMGADISNNSWGCTCYDPVVDDAIAYEIANDTIPIVSSGNNYGEALNNSPASSDGAITVGAIDSTDAKANFSNDGNRVDVVAPGVDILSLKASGSSMCSAGVTVNTNYCYVSGTSMASPHVSGLVSLMKAVNSSLNTEQTRQILRLTAEDLGDPGHDTEFGYGLIDANAALAASASPTVLTPQITSLSSRDEITGDVVIIGSADGAAFDSYVLEAGEGRTPSSWTTLGSSSTPVTNGTLASFDTSTLADNIYIFRLTVTNTDGDDFIHSVYDVEVNNFTLDISSPFNVMNRKNSIPIEGSVLTNTGVTFDYYTIEYGVGSSPASWSSAGITLSNGGNSEVSDGVLATWDTSGLNDKQEYTLRLIAYETGGNSSATEMLVATHSDLADGWPKKLSGGSDCSTFCRGAGVVFADLNGDNSDEIITAGPGNTLNVFNKDGSDFSGFPVTISSGETFYTTPVVGDVDGDLLPEIIIVSTNNGDLDKNFYVIDGDGSQYPGWTVKTLASNNTYADFTPSLGDVDGDGINEILYWGFDTHSMGYSTVLHAYNIDNTEAPGFPNSGVGSYVTSWIAMPPTITDLDGDNTPEIILAGYNRIAVFDNQGNILPGWNVTIPDVSGSVDTIQGPPAVGDVDGDSDLEIVFNSVRNGYIGDDVRTHAYEIDGTPVTGWPYSAVKNSGVGDNLQSPALADIDGDNEYEAILGDGFSGVIDHGTGARVYGFTKNSQRAPSIADFEGDGSYVIPGLYNAGQQWTLLSDLSQYWGMDYLYSIASNNISEGTIPAKDVDGNGMIEWGYQLKRNSSDMYAFLWEMQGTNSNPIDSWPMFAHDIGRTGRFEVGQVAADTTPPSVSITNPADGSTVS